MISSADFSFYKFHTVVHKPADRRVRKAGRSSIFLCPCDHAFGSVHVSDVRSGSGSRKSGSSGVGKQVQHLDRASGGTDFFRKPVPVCRLFREESRMFKAERLQIKGQIPVMDLPLLRKAEEFPFSAAFFTSVIMCVWMIPPAVCLFSIPDYLRVRADQDVITPAFQLFPAGTVYDFIIFPTICNPHD